MWPLSALLLLFSPAAEAQQKPQTEIERAIEEFKIETRNLGARADSPARAATASRRSWHGRIFNNFRNDALDAVPHEIRQRGESKSLLHRNQFGFNVAGPAYIPKLLSGRDTFFSVSYEGMRESISRTYLRTVPTTAERTGNWSETVDQAGNFLPIYDPATTRPNPAYNPAQPVSRENLQYIRDPFPNNRIPDQRLDPVAQHIVSFYPQPNASAGPFFENNFFVNAPEVNTANGMIGKVEHSLRERHRLSLELDFSNGLLGAAKWFPNAANPGPSDRDFATRRLQGEHIFTASSRTLNTAGMEASSETSRSGNDDDMADYASSIGVRGAGGQSFPLLQFSPYVPVGRSYPFSRTARNSFTAYDSVSTRIGKHSPRLSLSVTRYQVNTFWPQYPSAFLRFGPGLTSLPGIINTGHAFASFLLGMAEYGERSVVLSPSYFRRTDARLVLRDQYDVRKGLTLTIGLAIDRGGARWEKYDRQSTIDLGAVHPGGIKGALVAAGTNGYGRAFRPVTVRAEPSISVAWNPRGSADTVVRAGYSRSYANIPIYSGQWGTQGFSAYPAYISPNVQLQPAVTFTSGLPPLLRPLPDLRPDAADNTVADLLDTSERMPTYQSFSLSVERQMPASLLLSIGASLSGGKNLLLGNSGANPNAIPLDDLRYRDLLNDEEFNRSLRPYPQYKGFDVYSSYPLGRYQRSSAYVRVEMRASKGLSLNAYYELARQLDDYSGPYGKQDYFNRDNEWSLTPGVSPQRFSLSYVYELPFGENKPFLNTGDWRKILVDGWSLSGMASVTGGNPIYLRPEFNNTGGVVQALRVNTVPGVDPHVDHPGPDLWFNPAAFDQPPDFTIGDGPRTHPSLLNPGDQNYDLSLTKRFALSPQRTLQFSAVAFDFINHANWTDPDNVIGPASAPNVNAGKIIGSRGGRVIQLGLRFNF